MRTGCSAVAMAPRVVAIAAAIERFNRVGSRRWLVSRRCRRRRTMTDVRRALIDGTVSEADIDELVARLRAQVQEATGREPSMREMAVRVISWVIGPTRADGFEHKGVTAIRRLVEALNEASSEAWFDHFVEALVAVAGAMNEGDPSGWVDLVALRVEELATETDR